MPVEGPRALPASDRIEPWKRQLAGENRACQEAHVALRFVPGRRREGCRDIAEIHDELYRSHMSNPREVLAKPIPRSGYLLPPFFRNAKPSVRMLT